MSDDTGRTNPQDEVAIDPDGDPERRNPRDERDTDREDIVDADGEDVVDADGDLEVVNPYNT